MNVPAMINKANTSMSIGDYLRSELKGKTSNLGPLELIIEKQAFSLEIVSTSNNLFFAAFSIHEIEYRP